MSNIRWVHTDPKTNEVFVYDLHNNAKIENAYSAWKQRGRDGNNSVRIQNTREEFKIQKIDGEPDIQNTDKEEIDATVFFHVGSNGNYYYQITKDKERLTKDKERHTVSRIDLETGMVTYRGGKRKSKKSRKSRKSRKMRKSKRRRTKRN